jgi:hypothetical protein
VRRAEAIAAVLLSTAAVYLHYLTTSSAGALWRDEANTVGLATLPKLGEVWRNLQYDSFPFLWIGLVRSLARLAGPLNDPAFRLGGFVIGLTLLAALWINARAFKYSFPLMSLALLALNPSVIRWGDSLRGYGLGMTLAVLIGVTIWRFVEMPVATRFLVSLLVSLVSVHTLYYNAPVVFAFCVAGAAVAIVNKRWKTVIAIALIGVITATSLLIYVPTIRSAAAWNSVVTIRHYSFYWFFLKLDETFSPLGRWATTSWIFAFLVAIWAGLSELLLNRLRLTERDREAILFAVVAIITGALSLYAFLRTLSYMTQPWYYLILLTIAAVCIDIVFAKLSIARLPRVARLFVVITLSAVSFLPSAKFLRARMTNVDLVAQSIQKIAGPRDRVVVAPWYIGVSFSRYYHGRAPWAMLPSVGFERFQRFDLLRDAMEQADQETPVREVIDPVISTLKTGGSVYIVSDPISWGNPERTRVLPAAVIPRDGWRAPQYQSQWMSLFETTLRQHAVSVSSIRPATSLPVNDYEDVALIHIKGWRE